MVALTTSAPSGDLTLPSNTFDHDTVSNNGQHDHDNEDPAATNNNQERIIPNGIFARQAKFIARNPWSHFWVSFIIALGLSVLGIIVGEFSVSPNNGGWYSRGTLISNRQTQALLIDQYKEELATGRDDVWANLIEHVQPGFDNDDDTSNERRRLTVTMASSIEEHEIRSKMKDIRSIPLVMTDFIERRLQGMSSIAGGCNTTFYTEGRALKPGNLSPVWKTKGQSSAFDPSAIRDICLAEGNTQAALEAKGYCEKCGEADRCYPPYSLVFFARLTVGDFSFTLSCNDLAESWSNFLGNSFEEELVSCVEAIKSNLQVEESLNDQCPLGFHPIMVDETFGADSQIVSYTSSYFATKYLPEDLYALVPAFDRAEESTVVYGAYDNGLEDFANQYIDESLGNDMILALGSAAITGVAITVHTRSPWITLVGLLQVILSFPLSYFVYKLIAGLEFFPFINFMGVFVAFALGADIVFVAADKWKNARLNNRKGSTEDIAAVALPDAAGAMALTTSTTAVAFFGTAICPVAPLKCFAIFCGLLIVFDYILNILLIFPALCIYDKWQLKNKDVCFCCCNMGKRSGYTDENLNAKNKTSLIHGILSGFYRVLHAIRWPLFVICIAAAIVSAVFAARIELPNNSDVRMLKSSVQYEQNYEWRINLLSEVMEKKSGAPGYVIWGVTPADTGDHNNPATSSQLVLDDRFDASTTEGQTFLMNFCDRLFAEEFAGLTRENYTCPLNQFDSWLSREATSETPSSIYADNCAGVTGLPMPPKDFNPCITAWTNAFNVTSILERNGVVKIMYIEFQQRIRYDSRYDDLNDEWHIIEHWFENERASAPEEVNKVFHSSGDFAWYDTNGSMLQTAYGSAAIALAFSSLVVLISSRSVVLTLFSLVTIGYVLTATTALLVAIGWTLGFLESICFAILIGISCDFVIHFGHAYASLPGIVSRDQRTKFALIHMGPSILAAAFTTIASAIVMIFTVNTFFVKFAIILFFTILQATVGSFIVFLTFTDCVGPNEPTYLWDKIAQRCQRRRVDDAEYAEGDTSVLDMDKTIATKAAHEDSFDR